MPPTSTSFGPRPLTLTIEGDDQIWYFGLRSLDHSLRPLPFHSLTMLGPWAQTAHDVDTTTGFAPGVIAPMAGEPRVAPVALTGHPGTVFPVRT